MVKEIWTKDRYGFALPEPVEVDSETGAPWKSGWCRGDDHDKCRWEPCHCSCHGNREKKVYFTCTKTGEDLGDINKWISHLDSCDYCVEFIEAVNHELKNEGGRL